MHTRKYETAMAGTFFCFPQLFADICHTLEEKSQPSSGLCIAGRDEMRVEMVLVLGPSDAMHSTSSLIDAVSSCVR